MALRLITFGRLALMDGDTPVGGAAAQRSRLALLAVLAASGASGIARDKLLACLWPESDSERARHALKQSVYSLRRELGNDAAIAGTATLCLDPSVLPSDVREFEDAITRGDDEMAVALYTGAFLDGFHLKDGAEFDRWRDEERDRRAHEYADALERLAARDRAAGHYADAVRWWRRRAANDPLSGRVALALMRAHADAGDLTGAIQHARVHEMLVRQELESAPDDAVLELAARLRRGEWTAPPPVPAMVAPPSIAQPASAPVVAAGATSPPSTEVASPTPVFDALPGSAPAITTATDSPAASAPAAPTSRRRRLLTLAATVVAVVAGSLPLVPSSTRTMASVMLLRRSAPPLDPRRIVVAAFENRTGDSALAPAGELAADWIARSLLESNFEVVDSRTSAIAERVVASMPRLLRGGDPATALARETGAGTVVTGRYYKQGDSLQFEATVSDVTRGTLVRAVGPLRGAVTDASPLVGALAMRVTAALAASTDSAPGASTAALVEPPSIQAFEHTSRAWEMFFARPDDTASVFRELDRASALDTAYSAPQLIRAYVLDVKEQWPELASVVAALQPRRSRIGRIERLALELFEEDLRGDQLGRLRTSRELVRLSPASADMALLLAVSATYLNRFAEADAVLAQSDPNRGVNLVSPVYWEWRSTVAHLLGRADAERRFAEDGARRFPSAPSLRVALARAHAGARRLSELRDVLSAAGFESSSPSMQARSLALFAARELDAHGAHREADSLFARVAALPAPGPNAPRTDRQLHALALYEARRLDVAREAYLALLRSDSLDLDAMGRLGALAMRAGDSVAARRIDERLARWSGAYAFGQPAKWRAHQAAIRGDAARAVALLHTAIEDGYHPADLGPITLHEERDFAGIRDHSGFRDLVRPRQGPPELP